MSAPFPLPDAGDADLARTLHARRALEQALDHGIALLAALGLPQIVGSGFTPIDPEAADAALAVAVALLDEIDAPGEDLEPNLGAPEQHEGSAKLINGCWIRVPADQRQWADGGDNDCEGDVADEPHDEDSDAEPSIGWPEHFAAKLDEVLQSDHDPEADDADFEEGGSCLTVAPSSAASLRFRSSVVA